MTADEAQAAGAAGSAGKATSFGDPRAVGFREESRRWLTDATRGFSRADRMQEPDADILARRLAWELSLLERWFPNGFGCLLRDLRTRP